MNAGISEEVGQTTRGFIDAMKGQPALLAMIAMNALMLALLFYLQHGKDQARRELIDYVKDTSRLLAQCSVIPPENVPKQ
jgi:hypothetical protein